MTQDEIIRMAYEAELMHPAQQRNELKEKAVERFFNLAFAAGAAHEREVLLKDNPYLAKQLQAYIHIATTVEREACAKVCESDEMRYECSDECAAAIRARGDK